MACICDFCWPLTFILISASFRQKCTQFFHVCSQLVCRSEDHEPSTKLNNRVKLTGEIKISKQFVTQPYILRKDDILLKHSAPVVSHRENVTQFCSLRHGF